MPRLRDLVHTLILPHRVGDTVLDRFTVTGAELNADESQVVFTFAPNGLQIAVTRRSAAPSFAQTPSFNVLFVSNGPTTLVPDDNRLLMYVLSRIRANDPGQVRWKDAPTLFLVPGVICNPFDLSLRAVDVLREADVVLVEPGKESITAELLALHGVVSGGKRIVPLPEDAAEVARLLDEVVAQNEDACLFGADEGLPGFNDPGKSLLAAAAALGDRLHVRTIGGPSALAMALLRIPVNLDRFVFLGVNEDDPAGVVERIVRQGNDMPLILFLGAKAGAVGRRIAEVCLPLGRELFFACNLTCENEHMLQVRPGDGMESLPLLDPATRVVLVVGPPPSPDIEQTRS